MLSIEASLNCNVMYYMTTVVLTSDNNFRVGSIEMSPVNSLPVDVSPVKEMVIAVNINANCCLTYNKTSNNTIINFTPGRKIEPKLIVKMFTNGN